MHLHVNVCYVRVGSAVPIGRISSNEMRYIVLTFCRLNSMHQTKKGKQMVKLMVSWFLLSSWNMAKTVKRKQTHFDLFMCIVFCLFYLYDQIILRMCD